jgi:hypothetical protein
VNHCLYLGRKTNATALGYAEGHSGSAVYHNEAAGDGSKALHSFVCKVVHLKAVGSPDSSSEMFQCFTPAALALDQAQALLWDGKSRAFPQANYVQFVDPVPAPVGSTPALTSAVHSNRFDIVWCSSICLTPQGLVAISTLSLPFSVERYHSPNFQAHWKFHRNPRTSLMMQRVKSANLPEF